MTLPPADTTLGRLALLGDPRRPDALLIDLENWWLEHALDEYEEQQLLPSARLRLLRELTWRMVDQSARAIDLADSTLRSHPMPEFVKAMAVIGSVARAEATPESDVDWNVLLDDLHLRWPSQRGAGVSLLDPSQVEPGYCEQLARRDLDVRLRIDFDLLIENMAQQGFTPRPKRADGSAGERLRAFAERELLRPYPDYARSGIAAPVLTASAPLSSPADGYLNWSTFRARLSQRVERSLVALAWICQVGDKLARLARQAGDNSRAARHAAHGVLSAVCQALLILHPPEELPPDARAVVPYWRAPVLLRGFPHDIRRNLAQVVYLVASSRVQLRPPGPEIIDLVFSAAERALDVAGPSGRRWLSQVELDTARRALRLDQQGLPLTFPFCR